MLKTFKSRGLEITRPSPRDMHRTRRSLAFGVGYTTLLTHLAVTLGVLAKDAAPWLAKVSPKAVRSEVLCTRPGRLAQLLNRFDVEVLPCADVKPIALATMRPSRPGRTDTWSRSSSSREPPPRTIGRRRRARTAYGQERTEPESREGGPRWTDLAHDVRCEHAMSQRPTFGPSSRVATSRRREPAPPTAC